MFDVLIPIGIFILCLGGACAFVALAYFLVSMVITIDRVMEKVNPLLTDVKSITEKAQPLLKKANPMLDRVTLTIDAANLEIMRVDQVLQDVNVITGNLAQASSSIDTAASTPVNFIGNVSSKLRSKVAGKRNQGGTVGVVMGAVEDSLGAVDSKVAAYKSNTAERRVELEASAKERESKLNQTAKLSEGLQKTVSKQINADTK